MNFTIDSATLRKSISILQGVSEKKSGILVLASILVEAKDDALTLTATDLDVTLTTKLNAEVKEEGSLCIPAKRLYDIVRSLRDGDITFKSDPNDWVRLTCNKSKFRLQGLEKKHFPTVPEVKGDAVTLGADTLKSFIKKTIFAVSEEVTKFTLAGAKLEVGKDEAKIIATDGLRIAINKKELNTGTTFECLIPRNALVDLEKFITDDVLVTNSDRHISFESGLTTLTARKLTGLFPDYRMALPKDNNIEVTVDATVLYEAVKRVALVADDTGKAITMDVAENEIKVWAVANGEAEETVPCTTENFKKISVILNWKFLTDFLDECKTVTIKLKDSKSAVELIEGDAFCLLMPLRK